MNPMRLGGNNKRTDESWIAPTFSGLAALPYACVMSRWYPTSGPTAPERQKKRKKNQTIFASAGCVPTGMNKVTEPKPYLWVMSSSRINILMDSKRVAGGSERRTAACGAAARNSISARRTGIILLVSHIPSPFVTLVYNLCRSWENWSSTLLLSTPFGRPLDRY